MRTIDAYRPLFGDLSDDLGNDLLSLTDVDPSTPLLTQDQEDQQTAVIAQAVQTFIDQMNAYKAQVQSINDALYQTVSNMSSVTNVITGGKSAAQSIVDGWHGAALAWMNEATGIVSSIQSSMAAGDLSQASSTVNDWITSGGVVLSNAQNSLQAIAQLNSSLWAQITNTAAGLVPNLQAAWQAALNAAAQAAVAAIQAASQVVNAAGSAAGGLLGTLLLPIGLALGGLGLLLILFDKSSGGRAIVNTGKSAAEKVALAGLSDPEQRSWNRLTRADVAKMPAGRLVQFLRWNDPNGEYNQGDSAETLREILTQQWLDNAEPSELAKFGRHKKGVRHVRFRRVAQARRRGR